MKIKVKGTRPLKINVILVILVLWLSAPPVVVYAASRSQSSLPLLAS